MVYPGALTWRRSSRSSGGGSRRAGPDIGGVRDNACPPGSSRPTGCDAVELRQHGEAILVGDVVSQEDRPRPANGGCAMMRRKPVPLSKPCRFTSTTCLPHITAGRRRAFRLLAHPGDDRRLERRHVPVVDGERVHLVFQAQSGSSLRISAKAAFSAAVSGGAPCSTGPSGFSRNSPAWVPAAVNFSGSNNSSMFPSAAADQRQRAAQLLPHPGEAELQRFGTSTASGVCAISRRVPSMSRNSA